MSGIYSTNKIKNLNQLNDVNITDISNDEVIKYNASTGLWENGSAGVENISELNDVSITSVANDELLKYNTSSGKWENTDTIDVEEANIDRMLIRNVVNYICALGFDTVYGANQNWFALAQFDSGNTVLNCKTNATIYFMHANNNTLMTMNNTAISLYKELEFRTGVELKTNGSYGTTGAVLTSRGTNNSPIWTDPYRIRVYKNTTQTINDNVITKIVDWLDDTNVSTSQGSSDFDITTSVWSPSVAGVYDIKAQVYVSPASGAEVLRVILRLQDTLGNIIREADYTSDNSDEGVYQMTLNFNDMIYTNNTTDYELFILVDRKFGGTTRLIDGTNRSWFSAYKIG